MVLGQDDALPVHIVTSDDRLSVPKVRTFEPHDISSTQKNWRSSVRTFRGISSCKKCPQSRGFPVTGAAHFSRQVAGTFQREPIVPFPPHRT